jgi:hypothetical protein
MVLLAVARLGRLDEGLLAGFAGACHQQKHTSYTHRLLTFLLLALEGSGCVISTTRCC